MLLVRQYDIFRNFVAAFVAEYRQLGSCHIENLRRDIYSLVKSCASAYTAALYYPKLLGTLRSLKFLDESSLAFDEVKITYRLVAFCREVIEVLNMALHAFREMFLA